RTEALLFTAEWKQAEFDRAGVGDTTRFDLRNSDVIDAADPSRPVNVPTMMLAVMRHQGPVVERDGRRATRDDRVMSQDLPLRNVVLDCGTDAGKQILRERTAMELQLIDPPSAAPWCRG